MNKLNNARAALLLVAFLMTACGQKGNLYMPSPLTTAPKHRAAAAPAPSASAPAKPQSSAEPSKAPADSEGLPASDMPPLRMSPQLSQ